MKKWLRQLLSWMARLVRMVPNRVWRVLLFLSSAVVAATVVLFVPAILVTETDVPRGQRRLELRNDVRGTLVQALGGALLAGGLYYTARSYRLNQEGQITERFTRAIDQVGATNLELRLGGIYALERIARDSRRDYGPICEILTAFVRRRCPWDVEMTKAGVKHTPPAHDHLEPDVQAAMSVLGRRQPAPDPLLELNLSRADLAHANLHHGRFRGTLFFGSNLQVANFNSADLQVAFLIQVDASNAFFEGANLKSATLSQSLFRGATFKNADLRGADLQQSNLAGADLTGARLEGANLRAAVVADADLAKARTDASTRLP